MREKYESLPLTSLKEIAKARGVKGVSTMKKADIIELMLKKDEQDKAEEAKKDVKIKMMLEQPHINEYQLAKITAKTLILVGSDDMIKESHTLYLAHNISGSQLIILPNENHSSYIINSAKLAPIIFAFLKVA